MSYLRLVNKGEKQLWRWLIIAVLFFVPYFFNLVRGFLMKTLIPLLPLNKNITIAVALSTSLVGLLLFYVFFRMLIKREFLTVITKREKIDWLRVVVGFSIWGFFTAIFLSLNYFSNPDGYQLIFNPSKFIPFFITCMLFMPFQVLYIEIVYRGFLLQGLSLIFKRKWVIAIISSVFYSILLIFKSSLSQFLGYEIVIYFFITSLMLACLTLIDEGIELSVGTHFANNLISATYIAHSFQPFKADAIFLNSSKPSLLFFVYLPIFIFCPLYVYILNKIFKWNDWKQKITGKVNDYTY